MDHGTDGRHHLSDPATYYSILIQSVIPRCHFWISTAGSLRLDLSAPRKGVTAKLRLQGSALAAALASPAVSSALADVSYRTGAGHTTGLSVVYQQVEPLTTVVRESAASPEQEFEVAWRGGDGLLDQMPDPEPVDGGPTRAAVDWHELAKHAPDVDDDERSMPAVADRKVLRRRGRVTVRRGFLRPPMSAEAGARATAPTGASWSGTTPSDGASSLAAPPLRFGLSGDPPPDGVVVGRRGPQATLAVR